MNDWLSEVNRYASEGTSKLLIGESRVVARVDTYATAVSMSSNCCRLQQRVCTASKIPFFWLRFSNVVVLVHIRYSIVACLLLRYIQIFLGGGVRIGVFAHGPPESYQRDPLCSLCGDVSKNTLVRRGIVPSRLRAHTSCFPRGVLCAPCVVATAAVAT